MPDSPAEPQPDRPLEAPLDRFAAVARFDEAVDRFFDEHLRGRAWLDRTMYTASELGDFALVWHLAGTAQGLVSRKGGFERAARLSATLGIESALVNGAIKSLFRRERPVPDFERPHHLRQPLSSSFPSGHASAAFVAAALLSERSAAKPLWYAMAVVVASSRVHVRIHHASDVVAGLAVGVTLGAVARRAWPLGRAPKGLRRIVG